ncbi:Do family serine endopeptidase [Hugenholtzia roseola]|uniref:Do family serine endopeptidase n=1 Tax=Hugenholtzia roseola TaxID=1002 RepID=UPI00047B89EC|nr:Do family serine endopeptidase [Hugenholtzia roseola]
MRFFFALVLAAILGGGVSLFTYTYFVRPQTQVSSLNPDASGNFLTTSFPNPMGNPSGTENFVAAAEKATPAVVHIRTFGKVSNRTRGNYYMMEELFKQFFGEEMPNREREQGGGAQERPLSSGSGVIVDAKGFIVTNNHVIEGADRIDVVMDDRRSFEATLIGKDPTTDLAVLKIEPKEDLPFLSFGNSDQVRVGEWVLAVGNPFDLTSTVTAGIVSAKGRNINILRRNDGMGIESFIQTDAAVNPGNSGGALINTNGELIGINTAIATNTGSYAGYSFAVPANLARKVVSDLKEYGAVQRALLGIRIAEITSELAQEKDLNSTKGVYVAEVNAASGAAEAGLKEGDVLKKIDGVEVNTPAELQERVARKRPGEKIKVLYERSGKAYEAMVELKNAIGTTEIIKNDASVSLFIPNIGAEVAALTDDEAERFGRKGLKVKELKDGKFKEAQIPEGFVITHIDKKPVTTPAELVGLLRENTGGGLLIEGFFPNGRRGFFAIGI